MPASTGRFRRADRLRRAAEFQHVTRRGQRVAGAAFVVISLVRSGGPSTPRLGITASRKLGGAVVRNHVKRQVREWFRAERSTLAGVGDLLVIGRKPAAELPPQALRGELRELARRLAERSERGGRG
jgi:ribonuclease P protein component